MAIGLDSSHQHFVCLYVVLLQFKLLFFWQVFGANCLPPLCFGVNATIQQQIVDLHNELRRRVAKGQEARGNPGPQPPAANMRKIVSNILLALHQFADNWSNTGFDCKWRSLNSISHYILILNFMECRRNIGIGQRRHYRREEHM